MKNSLETRLGIFFFLAIVAAVLILEMIGSVDFGETYRVTAVFDSVQDLNKGDPVKMAGVEIGRVDKIELINGRGSVQMKIDKKYPVKTDAVAAIMFTGLMGQYFVSIEGGTPGATPIDVQADTGTLETREQPDLGAIMAKLEDAAAGIKNVSETFRIENLSTLLGPVTDLFKQNKEPVTLILSNLTMVSSNIAQGTGTVGKLINDSSFYDAAFTTVTNLQEVSGDLKGFFGQAEGLITNANGIISQVQAGQGTLGKLLTDDSIHTDAAAAVSNLREILEKINQGEGSVGKLVNEETFYSNAKMTLQKVEKATEGLEDQGPLSVLGIAIQSLF